jgi:hypothetical protein
MARKPDLEWTVLPHDAPEQLAPSLWRVEGDLPNMALRRCMVVSRLADGGLVIHNGMALDEPGMAWLESLGRPAWLVVPNGWHRLDAAKYLARYPDLKVICPSGSRAKVEQQVAVHRTYQDVGPLDAHTEFIELDGTKGAEGVMRIRSEGGVTLVFNDAIFNLEHGEGLFWWIYGRLLGNAGRAKVTTITRLLMVKQKAAFRAHLLRLADDLDLRRIIVAHGAVIRTDATARLRAIAEDL